MRMIRLERVRLNSTAFILATAMILFMTGPATADGPAVGQRAPDFSLFSTSGEKFHLSERQGRTVLMTFWSTWCSRSSDELAFLKKNAELYPSLEIAVVYSGDPKPDIRSLVYIKQVIDEWDLPASILVDRGQKVWELFGVKALPTSFIIDPNGVLAYGASNFYSSSPDELNTLLGRMSALSMAGQ